MTGWLAGDVVRLDDGSVWGMVVNGDYWVLLGDRENAYLDDDATTYSSAIDRRSPTLIARGGQPVPTRQDPGTRELLSWLADGLHESSQIYGPVETDDA